MKFHELSWHVTALTSYGMQNSCGSKGTMFGQLCDVIKERGSI